MLCYYRLSSAGFRKPRIADRQTCLASFLAAFGGGEHRIVIIADNFTEGWLWPMLEACKGNIEVESTSLGNTGSFLHAMAKGAAEPPEQTVYLVEDDYLHMPSSPGLIEEGLAIAAYVTLYDCGDKYADPSPNPGVVGGSEPSRVRATRSTHWKYTNGTTCTFAAKAKTLAVDLKLWQQGNIGRPTPDDYSTFKLLTTYGNRDVASCIPGRATHTELPWLSPFVDWQAFAQNVRQRQPIRNRVAAGSMDAALCNRQMERPPFAGIGSGRNAMAGV